MTNLNDSLPDLMRRATEHLEPESTDLVERGLQRGAVLRRRRTALLSLSGVGAVLATAGIVVGGTQVFGSPDHKQAPVAGTPTAAASTKASTGASTGASTANDKPATPADTMATLRKLLPTGYQVSKPTTWGGVKDDGLNGASVILNDGKGPSQVLAAVFTNSPMDSCKGWEPNCKVQPDGSFLITINERRDNRYPNDPKAGIDNTVEIHWKDGRAISLMSFNAAQEKAYPSTRPKPILSTATLLKMAKSDQWGWPPKPSTPTAPPVKITAAPPVVPLARTLATLKNVLPGHPQVSKPVTWGGGDEGMNSASYVANDGKGAAEVGVSLTTSDPITKCAGEGYAHCKVRPDGSVLSWTKDEPSYGDARQDINGVLGNVLQLAYPDGRQIRLWSYNGPSEKDNKHTRAKPIYSIDQLTAMATSKQWVFPGGLKSVGGDTPHK